MVLVELFSYQKQKKLESTAVIDEVDGVCWLQSHKTINCLFICSLAEIQFELKCVANFVCTVQLVCISSQLLKILSATK